MLHIPFVDVRPDFIDFLLVMIRIDEVNPLRHHYRSP